MDYNGKVRIRAGTVERHIEVAVCGSPVAALSAIIKSDIDAIAAAAGMTVNPEVFRFFLDMDCGTAEKPHWMEFVSLTRGDVYLHILDPNEFMKSIVHPNTEASSD